MKMYGMKKQYAPTIQLQYISDTSVKKKSKSIQKTLATLK